MKIKKGTLLQVNHVRKGNFIGMAIKDFDTETDEFYPISLAQKKAIIGLANDWEAWEEVPCRNSLCKVKIIIK